MAFTPSARSLPDRLGLTDDTRLLVLGAPPRASDWPGQVSDGDADVVVIACRSEGDVAALVPLGLAARRPGGRLWLAYDRRDRTFGRSALAGAVEALGLDLTWYRQTALPDDWSAIWFKRRSEFRTLHH
jgi:hypothetical protein